MPIPANKRIVPAGSTPVYTATMKDHDGTALALTQVSSITLTVKDKDTGQVIRNAVDAKNANNVTIHATSGLITWQTVSADTTFVSADTEKQQETRIFTFSYVWTSGSDSLTGIEEDFFIVDRVFGAS